MLGLIMVVVPSLLASYVQAQQAPITVQNAWIREAPPNVTTMVGYLTLHNNTSENYTLTCAKSDYFKGIEFHRTVIKDDMASMHHHNTLAIPPFGSLVFKPGDYHLMLMGPRTGFKAGDELMVTLCILNNNKQAEFDIVMPVKKSKVN